MDDIAIRVEQVSKDFRLPHEKNSSVKNLFVSALKNIGSHKTYEVQHALQDVSFEIKKGEFFGIVGRNGSGKSTLLKMLAGIYQPTKGSVKKTGRLVPFIELGVGFNPELTGRQNVYLNGALLGFSEKEVDALYDDVVAFAELEEFMDQKLKNYSSGMQVRLAFSMAIRAQADILLIDEVLAVGDADFQRKCFQYFLELKAANKTVVFVSHDMNAVRLYCDRAMLIDQSKMILLSSAEEVSEEYTKLFEETGLSDEDQTAAEGVERWGTRKAIFTNIKVERVVKAYQKFGFEVTITAQEPTDELVFGFSIKNAAQEKIIGTNTIILRKQIKPLKKGEMTKLVCNIPNIFSSGTHYMDVAIQTNSYEYIEYWKDAAKFEVFNNRNTPYKVSPEISIAETR